MDWYLIGRILGVLFWPAALAVVVYGVGWIASIARPPRTATEIRRWSRMAAVAAYFGTLFVTGRDLLRYAGVLG